jgi:hypothetical protein
MGDWFQTVVDKDAEEEAAPRLAAAIHEWLVNEGIVDAEPSDCLYGEDTGFAPGPNYSKAVGEGLGEFLEFRPNGLEIVTKRTVFHAGGGGCEFICSVCSMRADDLMESTLWQEWHNAVDEWYEKQGPGILKCQNCGNSEPVTEWHYDPPWAFAELGFKFWNWPPLNEKFVKEVGRRLGHRVVLVSGK